jgi:hypothetical protein
MRNLAWLIPLVAIVAIASAEPGTGIVIIGCNEPDATLLVDGVLIPERTPAVLTLPVGSHTIEARKSSLLPQKRVVDVGDQQQVKIRFELLPPGPPPGMGSDAIGSGAGSGSAALGSAAVGSAALGPGSAAPPPAVGSAAAIGPGSNAHVEAPPSNVTAIDIATTAPHAIAYLDGAPVREAPCVLEVEPGEHVVAVVTTGMIPAEAIVTAKSGQRQRVELTPKTARKRLDVPAK